MVPTYGPWIYPLAVYAFGLIGYDIYIMIRKVGATTDPVVHNQLVYLILGVVVALLLSAFSATRIGQEYPWSQVGNLLMALMMTYAVVRHRLLDLRFVLRRGLALLSMLAIAAAAYLALYLVLYLVLGFEVANLGFLLSIGITLFLGLIILQMRGPIATQIDKLFYKDSYDYRNRLDEFARNGIRGVMNLDEFGIEIVSLFCGAVGPASRSSCFLSKRRGISIFVSRFRPMKTGRLSSSRTTVPSCSG